MVWNGEVVLEACTDIEEGRIRHSGIAQRLRRDFPRAPH